MYCTPYLVISEVQQYSRVGRTGLYKHEGKKEGIPNSLYKKIPDEDDNLFLCPNFSFCITIDKKYEQLWNSGFSRIMIS